MGYTIEFWLSEQVIFRTTFRDSMVGEEVLSLCIRGLTLVATETLKANPAHRGEVLQDFRDCFDLARKRMGHQWLVEQTTIFAGHGMPA